MSSLICVVPPAPSQTIALQSPVVCAASRVPEAAALVPQVLLMQVRVLHSVSEPGQSEAATHSAAV